MGYMYHQHACNTGGPGFDSTLKCFFHICRQLFSLLKNSNFSFLTWYRDAYGYIKKVYQVDNAINAPYRAVWHIFYGLAIVKVGWNNETSDCNSQMGYKTKLLKHGGDGQ